MIGKGAHQVRPATLAEVEKVLEKRQGTAGEFGFEQQTTLDYARRFARLKLADATELVSELEKLGLKPETAVKLADILPQNKGQLALILAKDKTELSDKKASELEELVAKYAEKAKRIEPKKEEATAEPPAGETPKDEAASQKAAAAEKKG